MVRNMKNNEIVFDREKKIIQKMKFLNYMVKRYIILVQVHQKNIEKKK